MLDLGELHNHIQALNSGDEASRRQAIHSLRHQGDQGWDTAPPGVIHSLVESLRRELLSRVNQPLVCQQVVTILGNMGPSSATAIQQLTKLLLVGNPQNIREAAATALGKIGKEARVAVDNLLDLLSNGRATLAVQAVRALADIGCADQSVRTALVAFWLSPTHSKNVQVRVACALCKLKIEATGLLSFLTSTLVTDQDASLRTAAAEGLAWCSKDQVDVVPALLTAVLNDKNEVVRQQAEAGLAHFRLSHEIALQLCSTQLQHSSYAEAALRIGGQLAVSGLIGALKTGEPAIREKAIRTLSSLGEVAAEAVPELTRALHDKDVAIRLAAAKALWNVTKKAEAAVPVLVNLLAEKWPTAQDAGESRRRFLQTVIEGLRRIGPPAKAAITALTEKTKDKNRLVSESAFSALREIAPKLNQASRG